MRPGWALGRGLEAWVQISIHRTSSVPIADQIADQIIIAIQNGQLQPGEQLAPIRQVARDLGVAPNTVVKAWSILEEYGWITASDRRGVFVSAIGERPAASDDELQLAAVAYLSSVRRLGHDRHRALAVLAAHLETPETGLGEPTATTEVRPGDS